MPNGNAMNDPPQRDRPMSKSATEVRRSRGLRFHFVGYFCLMAVFVAINLLTDPEHLWVLWPMLGWGGVLALHTAWTMGLFDILSGDR